MLNKSTKLTRTNVEQKTVIHTFLVTQGVVNTKCPVHRSIRDRNIYSATYQLVLTVHQSYTLVYSLATKTLQEQCSLKKRLQIKQTSKALLQSQSPSQMKYRPHCSDFPLSQKLAFAQQFILDQVTCMSSIGHKRCSRLDQASFKALTFVLIAIK